MNFFLIQQVMIGDIISLFSPKKPGVDPGVAKAQAEQTEKLRIAEDKEKREKRSRDQVVAANQGRRGRATLFQATGEKGVTKEKLGA